MIVSGHVSPSDSSNPVTVPEPSQLSVQPRSVIAGRSPVHSTVTATGGVANTGGKVSSIVIV